MNTFADRIIAFNTDLSYTGSLPEGIRVMNPYRDNPEALTASSLFYHRYYNDNNPRQLILGINPGRFGAGLTGVPFTDPKRLIAECGIQYQGRITHEPSSAYVYELIRTFGGAEKFYSRFYINSVCPLGFTIAGKNGNEKNYNYYDRQALFEAARPFIIENLQKHAGMGFDTDTCFCFGMDKNFRYLSRINKELNLFKKIIALEHPRYIMQYQSKNKSVFIARCVEALNKNIPVTELPESC